MDTINLNDRLILIKGQRGVGKTTLMLQRILKEFGSTNTSTVLYVSLDNIYFATNGLLDFVEKFHKMGGKHLFIDEVHKYKNWSREIKNAYDEFTDLNMVLSGSSLVNMMEGEADLSRRCISYELQGLSFREYLAMFHHQQFGRIHLIDILQHGNDICSEVNAKLRPLALFQQYLQQGYYPFLIEGAESYNTRIENVVNMTIETELPQLRRLDVDNIRKIQALLVALSSGLPYILDTTKLSSVSGIARTTLLQYLLYLHEARLINLLYSDLMTVKRMQKPDKIYIENTNLLHVLSDTVNCGTEREVFFVNQLSLSHRIEYSRRLYHRPNLYHRGGRTIQRQKAVDGSQQWFHRRCRRGICHRQQNSPLAIRLPVLREFLEIKKVFDMSNTFLCVYGGSHC